MCSLENVGSKVINTKSSRIILLPKCAVCGSRNSRFMNEKEAKGLLSSLGFTAPLSKI